MCRLAKTEVKQGKFIDLYHPLKYYSGNTYKSKNINPISSTPKFTLGIIQIIKAYQLFFSA